MHLHGYQCRAGWLEADQIAKTCCANLNRAALQSQKGRGRKKKKKVCKYVWEKDWWTIASILYKSYCTVPVSKATSLWDKDIPLVRVVTYRSLDSKQVHLFLTIILTDESSQLKHHILQHRLQTVLRQTENILSTKSDVIPLGDSMTTNWYWYF